MLFSIVLTIDIRKKCIHNKNISFWNDNIKSIALSYCERHNIPFLLLSYDNNNENDNPHVNILLESNSEDDVKNKFKFWMFNKGFVYVDETKNIKSWFYYSIKNDLNPIFNFNIYHYYTYFIE